MLAFILLNMTPFYVEKDFTLMSQRTPRVVQMHPTLLCIGTFFSDSLNCKYRQNLYSRSTGIREPQI